MEHISEWYINTKCISEWYITTEWRFLKQCRPRNFFGIFINLVKNYYIRLCNPNSAMDGIQTVITELMYWLVLLKSQIFWYAICICCCIIWHENHTSVHDCYLRTLSSNWTKLMLYSCTILNEQYFINSVNRRLECKQNVENNLQIVSFFLTKLLFHKMACDTM